VATRAPTHHEDSPFLLRVFRRKRLVPYNVDDENIVFAFPSEADLTVRTSGSPAQLRAATPRAAHRPWTVAVLVACAAALAGVAMYSTAANVDQMGSLRVESDPSGAIVTIDGTDRGTTPLVLALPSGPHAATVRSAIVAAR
jgi:hypothetical protein